MTGKEIVEICKKHETCDDCVLCAEGDICEALIKRDAQCGTV